MPVQFLPPRINPLEGLFSDLAGGFGGITESMLQTKEAEKRGDAKEALLIEKGYSPEVARRARNLPDNSFMELLKQGAKEAANAAYAKGVTVSRSPSQLLRSQLGTEGGQATQDIQPSQYAPNISEDLIRQMGSENYEKLKKSFLEEEALKVKQEGIKSSARTAREKIILPEIKEGIKKGHNAKKVSEDIKTALSILKSKKGQVGLTEQLFQKFPLIGGMFRSSEQELLNTLTASALNYYVKELGDSGKKVSKQEIDQAKEAFANVLQSPEGFKLTSNIILLNTKEDNIIGDELQKISKEYSKKELDELPTDPYSFARERAEGRLNKVQQERNKLNRKLSGIVQDVVKSSPTYQQAKKEVKQTKQQQKQSIPLGSIYTVKSTGKTYKMTEGGPIEVRQRGMQ